MKRKVVLSSYCWTISALTILLICIVFIYAFKQPDHVWPVALLSVVVVGLCVLTLFYMPLSISVDANCLKIHRPLRTKCIALSEISDVNLCPPTMAEKRICGSGGFFGWYGWFSERDLGKYFAYYGKASDCFLITLKSGDKYMLGCTDAPDMVAAIRSRIN